MAKRMDNGITLNTIYNEDCLETMKRMPDNFVDLVVADPPYNIKKDFWDDIENYEAWMKEVYLEIQRVLKDNGSFYWFHSEMSFIAKMMVWMEDKTDFVFRQFIVWNKRFEGASNKGFLDGFVCIKGLRNYQQMAEYCLYYILQDEGFTFNNQGTHHSVWNYEIERKNGHATPKPTALIKNILLHSSKEGSVVYDPFMGSGTTARACKDLGRNYIGSEISKEYCEIAEMRLRQEVLL